MPTRLIDFRALRERVPPLQVLQWFGWPGWRERSGEYRGPCPIHGSRDSHSRSLAVGPESFYCHSPRCHARGDAVDLYAFYRSISVYQAALEVCDRLGIGVPYLRSRR